jgi:hypothetical protein
MNDKTVWCLYPTRTLSDLARPPFARSMFPLREPKRLISRGNKNRCDQEAPMPARALSTAYPQRSRRALQQGMVKSVANTLHRNKSFTNP